MIKKYNKREGGNVSTEYTREILNAYIYQNYEQNYQYQKMKLLLLFMLLFPFNAHHRLLHCPNATLLQFSQAKININLPLTTYSTKLTDLKQVCNLKAAQEQIREYCQIKVLNNCRKPR